MCHNLSTLVSLPSTSPIGTLYGVSGSADALCCSDTLCLW